MGYRKKSKTYNLTWAADHEYHGLEVSIRGLSAAKLLEIGSQTAGMKSDDVSAEPTREMFETFAGCLEKWNLENEDGSSVAATLDGVLSQDLDFILELISAWMQAIIGVPENLPSGLNGGGSFPEEFIPMEALSPSPVN